MRKMDSRVAYAVVGAVALYLLLKSRNPTVPAAVTVPPDVIYANGLINGSPLAEASLGFGPLNSALWHDRGGRGAVGF